MNYFEFGPVVQYEMSFQNISYLPVAILIGGRTHFGNFGRGHYEEYSYDIILNWTSGSGRDAV